MVHKDTRLSDLFDAHLALAHKRCRSTGPPAILLTAAGSLAIVVLSQINTAQEVRIQKRGNCLLREADP
jgi:hypothetical protein